MAFVKLDCGMLDSTLWEDREAREVFITALLMAVPHVLDEEEPELDVETGEETGWKIPPGRYGLVRAAGRGIIRRALLTTKDGVAALRRNATPEPDSRTADFDGRRMVRVSNGFVVLNFDRYRQKDQTSAERARRYREAKSLRTVTASRRDVTIFSPSPSPSPSDQDPDPDPDPEAATVPDSPALSRPVPPCPIAKNSKPKRGPLWHFVPDDWPGPNDSHKTLALNLLLDVEEQAAQFRAHEFKSPKSDADRAFTGWLRRTRDFLPMKTTALDATPKNAAAVLAVRAAHMLKSEQQTLIETNGENE